MTALKFLQLNSNPIRAPPPVLLATRGVDGVLEYIRERHVRQSTVVGLLREAQFDVDEGALFPIVNKLIVGGEARMTAADLDHVDRCVACPSARTYVA